MAYGLYGAGEMEQREWSSSKNVVTEKSDDALEHDVEPGPHQTELLNNV